MRLSIHSLAVALFERAAERAREGRFVPIGGMYIMPADVKDALKGDIEPWLFAWRVGLEPFR